MSFGSVVVLCIALFITYFVYKHIRAVMRVSQYDRAEHEKYRRQRAILDGPRDNVPQDVRARYFAYQQPLFNARQSYLTFEQWLHCSDNPDNPYNKHRRSPTTPLDLCLPTAHDIISLLDVPITIRDRVLKAIQEFLDDANPISDPQAVKDTLTKLFSNFLSELKRSYTMPETSPLTVMLCDVLSPYANLSWDIGRDLFPTIAKYRLTNY
jgi:hypothetical protein